MICQKKSLRGNSIDAITEFTTYFRKLGIQNTDKVFARSKEYLEFNNCNGLYRFCI
jgi:hypothetical protein